MKKYLMTSAAVALCGSAVFAGGIDRSGQPIGIIFEETGASGSYLQLSFGSIDPTAGDTTTNVSDPLNSYTQLSLGFKKDISDALSLSFIFDQPFGADVSYEATDPQAGGFAEIESRAITALANYKLGNGFSVHGGIRALQVEGEIFTPSVVGFTSPLVAAVELRSLTADADWAIGAVAGVAYERPDIALRVSLTYSSGIDQEFTATEGIQAINQDVVTGAVTPTALPTSSDDSFTIKFPESWNLAFQTGVAADTLVFGSVRYVAWDGFDLTTDGSNNNYVSFTEDTYTYSLGVGRRINDQLSLAVSLGYEAAGDRPSTTALAPTTGVRSITVGGTYAVSDTMSVRGGVTYAKPGQQTVPPNDATTFDDNEVIGVGVQLGVKF